MIPVVAPSPPVKLWGNDKLEILRKLDHHRQWESLDEERYCIQCGNLLTGRDIQLIGGTLETGPLRAICPTEGCRSIPMDWVRPTDEVRANRFGSQAHARFQSPVPDQAA